LTEIVSIMDTQPIGQAIRERIALREMARLQVHFLQRLHGVLLGEQLVFRGGSALHGVYLHKRWSKDLDFFAPVDVASRIRESAAENGLLLEEPMRREEDDYAERGGGRDPNKRPDGTLSVFASPGTVYARVEIRVDVCNRDNTLFPTEERLFVPLHGAPVPVRVQRLSELMADKFGCTLRRSKPMDFSDLWLGLNAHQELWNEIRFVMEHKNCGPYDIVPLQTFTAGAALANLDKARETWDEKLGKAMSSFPAYDTVRQDLTQWLPFFNMRNDQEEHIDELYGRERAQ